MADYAKAYPRIIKEEGGYKLTNNKHDRGKQTYSGISRKFHPGWAGWGFIDRGEIPPTELVRVFYKEVFWDKMMGDQITSQRAAEAIMSQFVNGGVACVKVLQVVLRVEPDGKFGDRTLAALNGATDNSVVEQFFLYEFHHAVCRRYRQICDKSRDQMANLLGWLNRADGILL